MLAISSFGILAVSGRKSCLMRHVFVVGAGGIGCPAIQYLAAAGVGELTIVDDDDVSLSNLQRQVLFGEYDIGNPKVVAAKAAAEKINPEVQVNAVNERLAAQHFENDGAGFFEGVDVLLDGSDNYQTRLQVSDFSVKKHIPLVSAAIGQFQGQLGIFRGWEEDKPCYRCFVGDALDPEDCDDCSEVGVLGAMVGMMGSFAAMEAVRVITGFGKTRRASCSFLMVCLRPCAVSTSQRPGMLDLWHRTGNLTCLFIPADR